MTEKYKRISEMYNPELTDRENAVIIGVSHKSVYKWRKKNNISKLSKKLLTDKKISNMFNPELTDEENAAIIGVSPRRIKEWRLENNTPKPSKKLLTDKKISNVFNPELTDEENAAIIGVKVSRLKKWRLENKISKPSKKLLTDRKIAKSYNPELIDKENAEIIGVSSNRIKEWRLENNISKPSKKLLTDKNIAKSYNPELTDAENAEIIGMKASRLKGWRLEYKVKSLKVSDSKRQKIYKQIESVYNPNLTDAENATIIGVKPNRIYEWRKNNQKLVRKLHIDSKDDDWTIIKDFPDYMVSKFGQVYSMRTYKTLKPLKSIDGYVCYALTKNKKRYNVNIQKLVAEAFIPNPENKTIVIHIDGDKNNNVWTNLKWGYRSDSESFLAAKVKNGLNRKGKKNPKLSKVLRERYGIKVNQYTLDGEFIARYNSLVEASQIINIDPSGIGACCRGKAKSSGGYIWKYAEKM